MARQVGKRVQSAKPVAMLHPVEQVQPETCKGAPQAEPMEQVEHPAKVALRQTAQPAAHPAAAAPAAAALVEHQVPLTVRWVQARADRPVVGLQVAGR